MRLAQNAFVMVVALLALFGSASGQTFTKILNNGPDGQKLVFAVVGDGYAAADQAKYVSDVNNLVIDGVLNHDFYKDNIKAFNVYRLDLVSHDSGVSKPHAPKDTAFKTIYTGDWSRCWIEESPNNTNARLNAALSVIPKYDFVMLIQNEADFGGCRRGNRLYVTNGVGWDVVAHEYGHGIGGLFDEYSHPSKPFYNGIEFGPIVNARNCSTVLDAQAVSWSTAIANPSLIVPLPTVFNAGNMDPNQTVGEFQGCGTYQKGIYRPVDNCRMNSNSPLFCPVCLAIMNRAMVRYLGGPVLNSGLDWQNGDDAFSRVLSHHAIRNIGPQNNLTPENGTYLHVVMQVHKNGSPEIINLTQVQGPLPISAATASSSAFIINERNQPPNVEFLPDDPFKIRGFEDPKDRQGEFSAQVDSATITVDLPRIEIDDAAAGKVSLELNQVRGSAEGNILQNLTGATFLQQLRTTGRLKQQTKVTEGNLKQAARDSSKVRPIQ
jgi:hypothetical protein